MAEAEKPKEGWRIDGLFIALVLLVLVVLWLRKGGIAALSKEHINFGWQPAATSSSPFPFAPNFKQLAPTVKTPALPAASKGPAAPY